MIIRTKNFKSSQENEPSDDGPELKGVISGLHNYRQQQDRNKFDVHSFSGFQYRIQSENNVVLAASAMANTIGSCKRRSTVIA